MKDCYVNDVNYKIAKLLTLLDRNKYSQTYGSFDRNFWHYKIKDFPSGMSQEFILALALVYKMDYQNNYYYQNPRIKDFIIAGIYYSIKSSRSDSSTDDYFPYERALGAAVFSLYATSEACLLLNLNNKKWFHFFKKRGDWIIENKKSGRLTNHHAIAALALYNVYLITNEEKYRKEAEEKINRVISWQDEEGWYQEYEGCDPGYLSVTIDFLAQYYQKTADEKVLNVLNKAIHFFYLIQHPDGTIGGEYSSRHSYIFHPNGFEILAKINEKAR